MSRRVDFDSSADRRDPIHNPRSGYISAIAWVGAIGLVGAIAFLPFALAKIRTGRYSGGFKGKRAPVTVKDPRLVGLTRLEAIVLPMD